MRPRRTRIRPLRHLLQPRPSDPAPAEEIATLLDDDSERIKHTCGHGAVGSMSICWLAREHVIRDDRMPAQDLGQGVHIVEIAVCDPQGANTAPATARQ